MHTQTSSNSLANHVALVTGSSRGLGKTIAKTLGLSGAKVAINCHNGIEAGERTLAELQDAGCECMLIRASAIDAPSVNDMVKQVNESFGPIDILVPNATPDQPQKPIEAYSWDDYQAMIDFFIKSPFLLTQAVVSGMKEKGWGRIINIGSEVYQKSCGNFSAYVAAKGGQQGWTRSMATELAPYGITVNLVAPGWVPSERHANDPQAVKDAYLASVPAGRWGTPEDIAHAVRYFASEEASFITGQTLCANGGLSPN